MKTGSWRATINTRSQHGVAAVVEVRIRPLPIVDHGTSPGGPTQDFDKRKVGSPFFQVKDTYLFIAKCPESAIKLTINLTFSWLSI